MVIQSEYVLVWQRDGRGHFARVTVEVEQIESTIEIIEDLKTVTRPNDIGPPRQNGWYEAKRPGYEGWIDGALQGASWCAEKLAQQGQIKGCRVKVVCILGNFVDTNEESTFCAAALATWQALDFVNPFPTYKLIDGKFEISFS